MTELPKLKPVIVSSSQTMTNLDADAAVIIIDESHIEKSKIINPNLEKIDEDFEGLITKMISLGDFEGKWLQTSISLTLHPTTAKRIILLGGGKKFDEKPARARQLGIKAAEVIQSLKAKSVTIAGPSTFLSEETLFSHAHIGFCMGMYKYPNSNMTDEVRSEIEQPVTLTFVTHLRDLQPSLDNSSILNTSISLCRLLQDGPPNIVNPTYVSEKMAEFARTEGLSVQIMGREELKALGFGAMLAVAGGSAFEPKLAIFEYKPQDFKKTLAFVGKGLTMDTGGYSIKHPSTHQEGMKYDMSGAAVVLSSILAIARLKLPVHVYAVAALCENMIDAHSYRVGDILTGYSGKTIEIVNTDAEGRVVLSDALYYAAKDLKADYIIEYSTLTGAMISALGHVGAGAFAFDERLKEAVVAASQETGERLLPLPVWEEIAEDTKGTIADVCNVGSARSSAGSMSAAAFLKEFVNDVPFVHIDIAGVADGNQAVGYVRKGGSGYGVMLSVEIAKQFS